MIDITPSIPTSTSTSNSILTSYYNIEDDILNQSFSAVAVNVAQHNNLASWSPICSECLIPIDINTTICQLCIFESDRHLMYLAKIVMCRNCPTILERTKNVDFCPPCSTKNIKLPPKKCPIFSTSYNSLVAGPPSSTSSSLKRSFSTFHLSSTSISSDL